MYALQPAHWGRGLATEAAAATLDWAFEHLDLEEVIGLARPDNAASRRVLEKLGLSYAGISERHYGDRLSLYRLPRHLWRMNAGAEIAKAGRTGGLDRS